jgi:hypothetical protein
MLGLFGDAVWLWNVVGVSDAAVFAALWLAVGGGAATSAAGRPRGWRRNRGR